jgi:serine/threonine protein phosphatase PrpC
MGGHERGDYASRQVTAGLSTLNARGNLATLVEATEAALLAVHEHLRERGRSAGGLIGSTVVVLLVREGHAVVTWAGDSRAYHLRAGVLRRVSHDHSVVQSLVDQGLLDPDACSDHPLAHRITRAVGAGDPLHLDMDLLPVRPGDRFLLCSDGLDRHVTDADIALALTTVLDPQACANALVEMALARGGADNITCLVVDLALASGTGTGTGAGD